LGTVVYGDDLEVVIRLSREGVECGIEGADDITTGQENGNDGSS
jgi:hypothetical protein